MTKNFRILLSIILIVGVAVAGYFVFGKPKKSEDSVANASQEQVLTVQVQSIRRTTLTPTVKLLGRVVSFSNATLTSIVDAKVVKVNIAAGQTVNKDDVLVEFDTRNLRTRIVELDADMARIETLLLEESLRHQTNTEELIHEQQLAEIATESRIRIENLRQKNLIGLEQFENALVVEEQSKMSVTRRRASLREHDSRVRQLRSDLQRLDATRQNVMRDLEDSTIIAPFSGRVSAVHVALGGRVNTGTPVLNMYDHTTVEIQTLVPNRYLPEIRSRTKDSLETDAIAEVDGYQLPMKVDRLAAKVKPGQGGVEAFFQFTDSQFYPELNRSVDLYLQLPPVPQAIAIPTGVVDLSGRVNKVIDGRLRSVPIELHGEVLIGQESYYIAKSDALSDSDLLITTNLSDPIDGTKLEISATN